MINLLTLEPHCISRDLSGYITTVFGVAKIGKSTFASKFPSPLFLATERGYNALGGIYAVDITSWGDVKQSLRELKKPEVKEKFKTNEKVKVEITHGYIEEKREKQREQIKLDNDKYSFVFNKSMPLEDKVNQFITVEYNKDIPVDRISNYLYKPLMEIISEE